MSGAGRTLDFTLVAGEIRSLVGRRRALLTFLGSTFAALGLFMQNVLQGNLPPSLRPLEAHLFAFYGLFLLVPALVLSLRMAKLHAGMTLHGVLYERLLQERDFAPGLPARAARHNFLGAGFLVFVQSAGLTALAATLTAIALGLSPVPSALLGALTLSLVIAAYLRWHAIAAREGLARAQGARCAPYDRDEWQAHVAASLDDANQDMLAVLGFVALLVFSTFEGLSNLGRIEAHAELPAEAIATQGPLVFCLVPVVSGLLGLVVLLRLRVAQGRFSLQLDPSDAAFRPLRLTDAFLGYLLTAFLVGVALFVLVGQLVQGFTLPLVAGVGTVVVAVLAEKLVLLRAGGAR